MKINLTENFIFLYLKGNSFAVVFQWDSNEIETFIWMINFSSSFYLNILNGWYSRYLIRVYALNWQWNISFFSRFISEKDQWLKLEICQNWFCWDEIFFYESPRGMMKTYSALVLWSTSLKSLTKITSA